MKVSRLRVEDSKRYGYESDPFEQSNLPLNIKLWKSRLAVCTLSEIRIDCWARVSVKNRTGLASVVVYEGRCSPVGRPSKRTVCFLGGIGAI